MQVKLDELLNSSKKREQLRESLLSCDTEIDMPRNINKTTANQAFSSDEKNVILENMERSGFSRCLLPKTNHESGNIRNSSSEERKRLREALLKDEVEKVTANGCIQICEAPEDSLKSNDEVNLKREENRNIVVEGNAEIYIPQLPKDVLNEKYNWYEKYPDLYTTEIEQMKKYFPQFSFRKLENGHLSWIGIVRPDNVRKNAVYILMLVYENNYPICLNDGGSVRVYILAPDLDKLNRDFGGIPHLLYDEKGFVYLCTAREEDIQNSKKKSYSAAESLAVALKWIAVFELWLADEISTNEFDSHMF